MKRIATLFTVVLCFALSAILLTGCGSEAQKEMQSAITSANKLLEQGDKPFDPATQETLEEAIASADKAKDDEAYAEVTKNIEAASSAYENSVKQLKQVTNPEESFLIERAKTVESITDVEAATEETDPNTMMNKPGAYTSYIAMKSSLINDEYGYYENQSPVEAGNDGGAVIEAFQTEEDAIAREEYLSTLDGTGALSPGTHTVVGTLVVRTSNELTATQEKELEQSIIDALVRLED